MIAVLCGGVGAARFLAALAHVVDPADTVGIVNTGDDTVMHGLLICPDLDTVTYTLAGAIDPARGWGLAGESWRAMEALQRYAEATPAKSTVSTVVTLADGGDVSFQEYFVKLRHSVPVSAVRFDGAEQAVLSPGLEEMLQSADCIVIAPSNPIVSIGPIRALRGVDSILGARRSSVVAVSPIVGGAALKGPADRMLSELGHDPSVVGVARLYAPIAGTLVIDPVDAHLADAIEAEGVRAVVTPSVMSTPEIGAELARISLLAASTQ